MKKLVAALAVLALALCFAAARASADNVQFGVNDNAGFYGASQFWSNLTGQNLRVNTIILRWNEATADGFDGADGQFVAHAVQAAAAAGVKLEFDVSPRHSAELSDQSGPTKFAAWLTKLATTYPSITSYVVMNECNQDLFVNPQYQNGQNISAAECGAFLAAGYDALKAVNPSIFVWGLGLSPRGNVPNGKAQSSTDPIDWLGYLGAWYKQSGRTKPLMDGLDLHPYPLPQTLPFASGYADPHSYSVANLARPYQAFYNAFNGTAQPTVGPGHLPVQLNEVGIQTTAQGGGYTGSENVVVGNEAYQAQWYSQLVDAAECDADITNVNIFKLVDEASLAGWQSGLFYADWTAKASAQAVRDEIAKDAGHCPTGQATYWAPGATVAGGVAPSTGAKAQTSTSTSTSAAPSTGSTTGDVGAFFGSSYSDGSGFSTTEARTAFMTPVVAIGTIATVAIIAIPPPAQTSNAVRLPQSTEKAKPKKKARTLLRKRLAKGKRLTFGVKAKTLADGSYKIVVTLKATKGKAHATIASKPLTVKHHAFVLG